MINLTNILGEANTKHNSQWNEQGLTGAGFHADSIMKVNEAKWLANEWNRQTWFG